MTRRLSLLLAFCAVAALVAASPRHRRAIPDDMKESDQSNQTKTPCAPKTPCGWTMSNNAQQLHDTIINSYCECQNGTACQMNEYDSSVGVFVHHCRKPTEDTE